MSDGSGKVARAANIDDLKALLRALNDCGADYLLIGGYALHALGYQRGTTDIDIILPYRKQRQPLPIWSRTEHAATSCLKLLLCHSNRFSYPHGGCPASACSAGD